MRRTLIFSLLIVGVAVALSISAYSALAGPGPVTSVAGAVIGADESDGGGLVEDADDVDDVDDVDEVDEVDDGDEDGDSGEGNTVVAAHGVDGSEPNPDRGCANGSLDHAREVLTALLARDHPGENEGTQNALDKMCHGFFASADPVELGGGGGADLDESAHPGNGNAFGRGHGQGKPEGVPANVAIEDGDEDDGDEDDGDGPPDHAPAHGRR